MNIIVFGAGVQGTVFGVRLALAGHTVAFVARGQRAAELHRVGAIIQNLAALTEAKVSPELYEHLSADCTADVCLVTIRREQLDAALPELAFAKGIARFVFMANHAGGSEALIDALGASRVVLAFPGVAGANEGGVVRYLEVRQQSTAVDAAAKDVSKLFESAGFAVDCVADMDSWLKRHAIFIVSIAGALYQCECDSVRLSETPEAVRRFVRSVREGWGQLDRCGVHSAPFPLRFIVSCVPLWLAALYWTHLFGSPVGCIYFAVHVKHAVREMQALAGDIKRIIRLEDAPTLGRLVEVVEQRKVALKGTDRE